MPVTLDGTGLTPTQVIEVVDRGAPVAIEANARARAQVSHQTVLRVATRRPVYGRTTGVDANHAVTVDPAEPAVPAHLADDSRDSPEDHLPSAGLRLVRSHAGGAGPYISVRSARAMMLIRANQLLAGASGVDPIVIDALVDALNSGAYPLVHELGSVGTGDLTALSELALTLIGERDGHRDDLDAAAAAAAAKETAEAGTASVVLVGGDALALVSSSAATIAEASLAYSTLARLARSAAVTAAFSFLALHGSLEAYSPIVQAGRPYPGSVAAAARMRELVQPPAESLGSPTASPIASPVENPLGSSGQHTARVPLARVQDPYALRAFPQLHGMLLDALARLRDVLNIELNAAAENPFVSAEADDVFHHGSFHQAPLSLALDSLRLALLSNAQLNTARIAALIEPRLTGLSPFLASDPPGSSGVLVLEYTAASALAAMRASAMPVAFGQAVLSRGVEEHASFAAQAARQTTQLANRYRIVLAAELVCAVRALRLSGVVPASLELATSFAKATDVLPGAMRDRPLDHDLDVAAALLDSLG